MAIDFGANGTTYATGFVGEDDGQPSTGFGIDNISTNPITVTNGANGPNGAIGPVTKVGDTVVVTGLLPGSDDTNNTATTNTLYVTQYDNSGMILLANYNPNGPVPTAPFRYVLSNTALADRQRTTFTSDPALVSGTGADAYNVTCFARGTLIRTADGDIAVEDLQAGDVAVTASGAHRPIVWVGRRTIDCARHARPTEVLPVRISAHAFGENRPARDLVVSPGHSIAVDVLGEALIPASSLINGATIRQEHVERVTYFHVELESHDLLLSENLATESYMEMGNRGFFADGGDVVALYAVPDARPIATHADFCRSFYETGVVVESVRERLVARAATLGWTLTDNPLADLHLVVDGERLEPHVCGLSVRFIVPATATSVWMVSDTTIPMDVGASADLRELGVCLGRVVASDGVGAEVIMAADDARLCMGFHSVEQGPQRWTAGRACLPPDLWAGCRGDFLLCVDLTRPALPRLSEPVRAIGDERLALAS